MTSRAICSLLGLVIVAPLSAQVKAPLPPDRYDVHIRYAIDYPRNERIRQFLAMREYLQSIAFQELLTDDSDQAMFDATAERMLGSIDAGNARQIILDPRIETILLTPEGWAAPNDPNAYIKVLIELRDGLGAQPQQQLWEQAGERLARLGFRPYLAFDHEHYTRFKGFVPNYVLPTLLKDLRGQPTGWFAPIFPYRTLSAPLSQDTPIRVIEVLPEPATAPALLPPPQFLPPVPPQFPHLIKLSSDLRPLLEDNAAQLQPLRLEVTFDETINMEGRLWRERLAQISPPVLLEGRLGRTVTLTLPEARYIPALTQIPEVVHVRAPRSARPVHVEPVGNAAEVIDILKATGVAALHDMGHLGGGLRVILIDSDFTGWRDYVGTQLPDDTREIDLTMAVNPALEPAPSQTPIGEIGHGTHCALALTLAAPAVKLTLVRVDPATPYQLIDIARLVRGEFYRPEYAKVRADELEFDRLELVRRRAQVLEEYRLAFEDFSDTPAAEQRRRAAVKALDDLKLAEDDLRRRQLILTQFVDDIESLAGTELVVCPLVWNTGQPLNAGSVLSRQLDEFFFPQRPSIAFGAGPPTPPLWVVSAGDSRGQAWTGLFHDRDNNTAMEFLPADVPLPPERWTRELNFLGFQPFAGDLTPDLSAGTKLRVAVQWREAHNPQIADFNDLLYREPLVTIRAILLYQRDPSGESVASDEMELVALAETPALRLIQGADYAAYERTFEVTLPRNGRYALRLEAVVPSGTQPVELPSIPAAEAEWEFHPRLFVEVIDDPTARLGRPVFLDSLPMLGGVGVPGDAHAMVTVGAFATTHHPQPYSAVGAGPNVDLHVKPDVLVYDHLRHLGDGKGPAHGTSLATAYTAGMSAVLINAGAPRSWLLESLEIPCGEVLVIPEAFLRFAAERNLP